MRRTLHETDELAKRQQDLQVAEWENIIATNREIPDLTGYSCVVGIDFMKTTDFASVNLHFRNGDQRYDLNHTWICLESKDLKRIKPPWREWADDGLVTLVDDVEISPSLLVDYIQEMGTKYHIKKIAMDNFRYSLFSSELKRIGFDPKKRKNVKLVRPSDIMQVHPVVESCFVKQFSRGATIRCYGGQPTIPSRFLQVRKRVKTPATTIMAKLKQE